MRNQLPILVVFVPILLYLGSLYSCSRVGVARCVEHCAAKGLEMSTYYTDDPLVPDSEGRCICLVEAP